VARGLATERVSPQFKTPHRKGMER